MFTFTAFPKRTKRNAHPAEPCGERALAPEQRVSARNLLKRSARYLAVLVLSVLLVPNAEAQVLYGSLVGNVTDSDGAAIPGAKVEITNLATGVVTRVDWPVEGAAAGVASDFGGRVTPLFSSSPSISFTLWRCTGAVLPVPEDAAFAWAFRAVMAFCRAVWVSAAKSAAGSCSPLM